MLKKRNRADKKAVERIFKEGKFINSLNLTFKYILPHPNPLLTKERGNPTLSRISFIAPKNVAKLAVKRNFLRRKGYFALKKFIHDFPAGITGVFIFKKYQDNVLILENEIKTILDKIN